MLARRASWSRNSEVEVIIDAHSHWPQGRHPRDRLPTSIEDLDDVEPGAVIEALDELRIEKVVTLAQKMARIRDQWLGSNALAADLQARFPDRFVAIAACEPVTRKGQFDAAGFEEVRALVQSRRVRGLLMTPPYGHFALNDRRAYPFFQMACEHGVPIYVHQAAMFGPTENAPQFRARLSTVDQVVVDFPDLRLNIEHMAWPWTEELLAIMAHAPNVYTDLCMLIIRPRMLHAHHSASHAGLEPDHGEGVRLSRSCLLGHRLRRHERRGVQSERRQGGELPAPRAESDPRAVRLAATHGGRNRRLAGRQHPSAPGLVTRPRRGAVGRCAAPHLRA
jgi:predicted TIM-barrel fold metal-dependent hydrolase